MRIIFSILLIGLACYALLKKRKVDFFTVLCFSSLIYMYPGLLGEILMPDGRIQLLTTTSYACCCLWMVLLLIIAILNDKYRFAVNGKKLFKETKIVSRSRGRTAICSDDYINLSVLVLEIIEIFLCLYAIQKYGGIVSSKLKVDLLSESNKAISYMKYLALFTFVYSWISRGKCIKLMRSLSLIFIVYTMLLGHRSYAILGLICIAMYYLRSTEKVVLFNYIRKHKLIVVGIVAAALFFLFVKGVYAALLAGNYDLVVSRLTNPEYYKESLLSSEANVIMRNVYYLSETKFKYSFSNFILGFVTLIPFVGGRIASLFGYYSFSSHFNQTFNVNASEGYGIASSYIGECYALGGYIGIFVIGIFTFWFILSLNNKMQTSKTTLSYTIISIALAFFTFFIFRNSMINLLIFIRAQIYLWIVTLILGRIFQSLLRH